MEYERFCAGEDLTYREACLAMCFVCNGLAEGGEDCRGASCPLYFFMPYRSKVSKKKVSEEKRVKLAEILKKARGAKQAAKTPTPDCENDREGRISLGSR